MWTRALAKVGLVMGGLAMTVILLELALQLGSLFVDAPIESGTLSWQTDHYRFLALGDSNTYGVWLPERDGDAYPAQLERIWNDGQRLPAEVLNLGYPGTNSSRLLGLYPEFMQAFAPDVVLVMVGVNDFWTQPVAFPDHPTETGLLTYAKRHSRLYKGLYILLRRSGADSLEVDDAPDSNIERGEGTIRIGEHEFALGWNTEVGQPEKVETELRDNLRKLAAVSKLSSAQLVLMTYPGRFRYYSLANRAIRSVAKESGIPLIDLAREFRPLCPEFLCPQWLYGDQHPNEAGYRRVAETIASQLPGVLR
jgi:lysophospholipase L1-like esterase